MSDINWGEILSYCYFKCFSNPFLSLFSFCYSHQSNRWEYTFWVTPFVVAPLFWDTLLLGFCVSFLCSFWGNFLLSYRQTQRFIPQLCHVLRSSSKALFISVITFLISSITLKFLEFPSLCVYYPSVVCCLFFPLKSLAY